MDQPTLDELGEALGAASTVLRANAMASGLDARVPTCPEWGVRDLVVHLGMVHRWAAGHLRGAPAPPEAFEREGHEAPDLLDWFDVGATGLLQAIVDAPDDLEALVFLRDAPAPRRFWTRRQCHETTVHAVDALGARLHRTARPEETWIRPAIALDGIDELLVGFVPRRPLTPPPGGAARVLVRPDGAAVAWLVSIEADGRATTTRTTADLNEDLDHVLAGSAVELYLRLWNRAAAEPAGDLEAWWRRSVSVTW
ncbi:maleylpyruvate isomerase family mycothiol-dependent enzyme [Terrabacter sp. NPDC080008]|uniref:maleylpyruvate isomerase family mycothiol-dependent enzyme n=1 Tax=Terrabacter sp. NPDC080008 TaxID=3155176 RepID=UPI00344C07DE